MSECRNKENPGACEHCTCGRAVGEPRPGRVPWLLIGLVMLLGFALLFGLLFPREMAGTKDSVYHKTGLWAAETEEKP